MGTGVFFVFLQLDTRASLRHFLRTPLSRAVLNTRGLGNLGGPGA